MKRLLLFIVFLLPFLASCTKEIREDVTGGGNDRVEVRIDLDTVESQEQPGTRSLVNVSSAEEIKRGAAFVMNTDGTLSDAGYVTFSSTKSFLVSLNKKTAYDIYVICNYRDGDLTSCLTKAENGTLTASDLNALTFTCESKSAFQGLGSTGMPKAGITSISNTQIVNGNEAVTCVVENLYSKWNFKINKASFEALGYVVAAVSISTTYTNTKAPWFTSGYSVPRTDAGKAQLKAIDEGTTADVSSLSSNGTVVLYALENCQGTKTCSHWYTAYDEFGTYKDFLTRVKLNINAKDQFNNDRVFSYMVCLGADCTTDFNVRRNVNRTVMISLADDKDDPHNWFAFDEHYISVRNNESVTVGYSTSSSSTPSFSMSTTNYTVSHNGDHAYSSTDGCYKGTVTVVAKTGSGGAELSGSVGDVSDQAQVVIAPNETVYPAVRLQLVEDLLPPAFETKTISSLTWSLSPSDVEYATIKTVGSGKRLVGLKKKPASIQGGYVFPKYHVVFSDGFEIDGKIPVKAEGVHMTISHSDVLAGDIHHLDVFGNSIDFTVSYLTDDNNSDISSMDVDWGVYTQRLEPSTFVQESSLDASGALEYFVSASKGAYLDESNVRDFSVAINKVSHTVTVGGKSTTYAILNQIGKYAEVVFTPANSEAASSVTCYFNLDSPYTASSDTYVLNNNLLMRDYTYAYDGSYMEFGPPNASYSAGGHDQYVSFNALGSASIDFSHCFASGGTIDAALYSGSSAADPGDFTVSFNSKGKSLVFTKKKAIMGYSSGSYKFKARFYNKNCSTYTPFVEIANVGVYLYSAIVTKITAYDQFGSVITSNSFSGPVQWTASPEIVGREEGVTGLSGTAYSALTASGGITVTTSNRFTGQTAGQLYVPAGIPSTVTYGRYVNVSSQGDYFVWQQYKSGAIAPNPSPMPTTVNGYAQLYDRFFFSNSGAGLGSNYLDFRRGTALSASQDDRFSSMYRVISYPGIIYYDMDNLVGDATRKYTVSVSGSALSSLEHDGKMYWSTNNPYIIFIEGITDRKYFIGKGISDNGEEIGMLDPDEPIVVPDPDPEEPGIEEPGFEITP